MRLFKKYPFKNDEKLNQLLWGMSIVIGIIILSICLA